MDPSASSVIGAGLLFIASGCGPVLTKEQEEFLRNVQPNEFYPVEPLREILFAARQKSPAIVVAAGRRWGSAVKAELDKRGITEIKAALKAVCDFYSMHHKGDAGKIYYEDAGERAVTLTDDTPYPHEVLWGGASAVVAALGGDDVQVEPSEDPKTATIRWQLDD